MRLLYNLFLSSIFTRNNITGIFGTAKWIEIQQWCSFAYLKTFTFLNLERGADFGLSRVVQFSDILTHLHFFDFEIISGENFFRIFRI